MNLHLGLGHGVTQQQQLNLAPQLLQWLRLLQVPAQQLAPMVQHELETNPALEVDEDAFDDQELESAESNATDDDCLDARIEALGELDGEWTADDYRTDTRVTETERYEYRLGIIKDQPSLRESLRRQILQMGLDPQLRELAERIIGSLDSRGYLEVSLSVLADETGASTEALEDALSHVQACDPDGVGARDLNECLQLQLTGDGSIAALARRIVADYLDVLARGQIDAMIRCLGVAKDEAMAAIRLIRSLNPRPGHAVETDSVTTVVVPDVVIRDQGQGDMDVEVMTRDVPRLRLSRTCRELIRRGNLTPEETAYVRGRIRAAMFLMDGLQKREATLRRIALEIIRGQRRFLCGLEDHLRPLTMAKVAGMVGVHDTTVSRALAEKYVATPRGVYPMKYFFQPGYKCDDGSAQTPAMVRRSIHRMIVTEDPQQPLKDEVIARRLQQQGVPVARRTVAKYRTELGLPSSKQRALRPGRKPRPEAVEGQRLQTSLAAAG